MTKFPRHVRSESSGKSGPTVCANSTVPCLGRAARSVDRAKEGSSDNLAHTCARGVSGWLSSKQTSHRSEKGQTANSLRRPDARFARLTVSLAEIDCHGRAQRHGLRTTRNDVLWYALAGRATDNLQDESS